MCTCSAHGPPHPTLPLLSITTVGCVDTLCPSRNSITKMQMTLAPRLLHLGATQVCRKGCFPFFVTFLNYSAVIFFFISENNQTPELQSNQGDPLQQCSTLSCGDQEPEPAPSVLPGTPRRPVQIGTQCRNDFFLQNLDQEPHPKPWPHCLTWVISSVPSLVTQLFP